MWGYYDSFDDQLTSGDYVLISGIADELFQIKGLQFPADAIIENILPGGRLGTSTVPCKQLVRAVNNPAPPSWWDTTYDEYVDQVLPGSALVCGCYLRAADCQAVLCGTHLRTANGGPDE